MHANRVAHARDWFSLYKAWGYQPVPSDPDRKKPLCRYADWWDAPAPADLFDRFPSTNLQVMTGRHWKLAVLDLDGAEAVEQLKVWPRLPRTWTSFHTASGRSSRHLWFSLPDGLAERRRPRLWGLWDSEANAWKKHTAIELLCDRSLVMAPPSIHPKTRNAYGFAQGLSPFDMHRPAELPEWVWSMPAVAEPRPIYTPVPVALPRKVLPRESSRVDSRHVLDVITDKVELATTWGLRLARGGSGGWLYCHAIDREDRDPSAQFHPDSGVYNEPGKQSLSLFGLGVALGHYLDWRDCRDDLAARYLPKQQGPNAHE